MFFLAYTFPEATNRGSIPNRAELPLHRLSVADWHQYSDENIFKSCKSPSHTLTDCVIN